LWCKNGDNTRNPIKQRLHAATIASETPSLIGSDKVEGTPVYRSNGDKVGTIEARHDRQAQRQSRLCGDELRGFMGIGEDYYPLPWSLLTYNPRLEG
jgi:hypothetical protein